MARSLTAVREQRVTTALLVTGLSLSLVTGLAGAASAAPAAVSRGGFVVTATPPAGTMPAGRAQLVRVPSGRTMLTVHVTGLAAGHTYGVHLHEGSCSAVAAHYKHSATGLTTPPNELWASSDPANAQAGITANAAGNATGRGVAAWIARSTAGSVVIHTGSTTAGGPRLACADLV